MSEARRVLNLVTSPVANAPADFEELAEWIRGLDRQLAVHVLTDTPAADSKAGVPDLPTMTFSPGPLRAFRPRRGPVFQGQHVAKSAEYRALAAVGVPVPRWARVLPGQPPELEQFGEYVVTKPEYGARGAEVRIERRADVRWTPPRTRLAKDFGGPFNPRLAQEFVYTGSWPRSYRVSTLFGQALYAIVIEASHMRQPLLSRTDFHGQSVVSSGSGCRMALSDDSAVIALAEQAHQALSHVPLLGADILRDADTGQLFVVELNSLGYSWHFSSRSGIQFQAEFAFDLSAQFDGRRKAARVLAQACVRHAS